MLVDFFVTNSFKISGNNAVEMETTATYDPKTDELIVNTPTPLAQKYVVNGFLIQVANDSFYIFEIF